MHLTRCTSTIFFSLPFFDGRNRILPFPQKIPVYWTYSSFSVFGASLSSSLLSLCSIFTYGHLTHAQRTLSRFDRWTTAASVTMILFNRAPEAQGKKTWATKILVSTVSIVRRISHITVFLHSTVSVTHRITWFLSNQNSDNLVPGCIWWPSKW
jgi:hypothetical protein